MLFGNTAFAKSVSSYKTPLRNIPEALNEQNLHCQKDKSMYCLKLCTLRTTAKMKRPEISFSHPPE